MLARRDAFKLITRRRLRFFSQAPALVRQGLDLRSRLRVSNLSEDEVMGAISSFSTPLSTVKGVGKKTQEQLDQLGVGTYGSLMLHFPTNVIDRREKVHLGESHVGSIVTVEGVVERVREGNRGAPYVVTCRDLQDTVFSLTFFFGKTGAAAYAWAPHAKVLTPGARVVISGKLGHSSFNNNFEIINPDLVLSTSSRELSKALVAEPIYRLTAGLTAQKLRGMITTVLKSVQGEANLFANDWLCPETKAKHQWPAFGEAIVAGHTPESTSDLLSSRNSNKWSERLAFDELVCMCVLQIVRDHARKREIAKKALSLHGGDQAALDKAYIVEGTGALTEVLEQVLPFSLTGCQVQASEEIRQELRESRRMARCVQGDVGSGKTLVAIMGMLHTIEAGKQCALLAPTEILASQHHEVISRLFAALGEKVGGGKGPTVRLVTGNVKGKAREALLQEMRAGEADVVVGTHALLTDAVAESFRDLGLVVIDEEQRFGVSQRDALADRTNVLYTTATPIPRSLMLLVQDGYSVSTLDEKPPAKRPVQTVLVGTSLTDKVIARIQANIDYGSKVFWVTPCLSPSANMPGSSVQERYDQLNALFPGRVAMLHGQMSASEKAEVMDTFSQAESPLSVLVSTTVVEVGVDVPDASICVIDRAEQFGLSQMHQIRGRVGRGEKPAREILEECYCVLLYNDSDNQGNSKDAKEKLQILAECNDGFRISESDLLLRGPGDIFGLRQHGDAQYKVASLTHHSHLLLDAQREASRLLHECMEESTGGMRMTQLQELMSVFQRRKLSSSDLTDALKAARKSGSAVSTTATTVREDVDPAKAYLDWNNDVIEIMATIGVDRDEEAVQAGAKKTASRTAAIKRNYNGAASASSAEYLPQPIVDLSLGDRDGLVVVMDLETTGLKHEEHRIIQIAAKVLGDTDDIFNAYVKPVGAEVSPFISELTGIEQAFLDEEGMPFSQAWAEFVRWMGDLRAAEGNRGKKIVMLAHNGRKFDFDFLAAEVDRHQCLGAPFQDWTHEAQVDCFVDSLPIVRDTASWAGSKDKPKRFGQEALYTHLFGTKPENGHNAIFDVLALEEILSHPYLAPWKRVANKHQFLWKK